MAVGFGVWRLMVENDRPVPLLAETAPENPARTMQTGGQARAKTYNRIKLALSLASTIFFFAFALAVVATGLSRAIETFASSIMKNEYWAFLLFAGIFGGLEILFRLPLTFYSGFYLEHRYGLSNQTFGRWVWEQTKALLVSIPLVVPILLYFFYCLRQYGNMWWLPVGVMMFLATTLLARVAPKIIFPLFYKFEPLENPSLRDRVARLCRETGFRLEGVFTFNMSKNTKKANAGFTGIGKSKRVILGDTLLEKFSDDEIETVLAHELGHYHHGHIWKGIFIGTVSTFLGLFITSRLYVASLSLFGFDRIDDLAALPLLGLWLGVFGLVVSPLTNAISRKDEYEADRYAVKKSENPQAFVGALKKLADMNLADAAPNPVVEFLFYSHPSIEKRIRFAESNLATHASLPR